MSFNNELQHLKLFNQVKDIYNAFESFEEFNPTVCEPEDIEKIRNLSNDIYRKLQSIVQDLDDLQEINVNSYGC